MHATKVHAGMGSTPHSSALLQEPPRPCQCQPGAPPHCMRPHHHDTACVPTTTTLRWWSPPPHCMHPHHHHTACVPTTTTLHASPECALHRSNHELPEACTHNACTRSNATQPPKECNPAIAQPSNLALSLEHVPGQRLLARTCARTPTCTHTSTRAPTCQAWYRAPTLFCASTMHLPSAAAASSAALRAARCSSATPTRSWWACMLLSRRRSACA